MRGAWGRILSACCAGLALACGSPPGPSATFDSAHWSCTRRVEGGRSGRRLPAHFEVWLGGDRALIRGEAGADRINVLRLGPEIYSWREGDRRGLKWVLAATSDERALIVPSVDYVFRAAACRDHGSKYNSGTFDGHPFVGFQCRDETGGTKRIVSLATDLSGFPIHSSIAYADGTTVIYDGRSAQVPAVIPAAFLELPPDVTFEIFRPAPSP